MYDAKLFLKHATPSLIILVTKTTLWANPEVYKQLVKHGGSGAWYPNARHFKKGEVEKNGLAKNGARLDNNTYANYAIKQAVV